MRNSFGTDFVDLGCDHGTTIDYCRGVFDGGSVLAIDIRDEGRKKIIEEKGNSIFICGNALEENEHDSVRFVSGGHFLEHLKGFNEASIAVNNAMNAAREFAFFNNPDFGGCERSHEFGFKYYWEEQTDHIFRITRDDMVELAKSTGHSFCVFSSHRLVDSNDTDLWPVDVGSCGCIFDGSCEKKEMTFEEDFFKITSMIIWKRMSTVLKNFLNASLVDLYFDGRK